MTSRIGWFVVGVVVCAAPAWAAEDPTEARMRKDVTFLASDECEGRGVATQGIHKAADHVAAEFKKAGLKPGAGGSYFQPFTINGRVLEAPPVLVLRGPDGKEMKLKVGEQFDALGLAPGGKVENAPVVFAGYGVTDPSGYDDFDDVDVTGKVVIVMRGIPRADDPKSGLTGNRRQARSFTAKLQGAEKRKALAVLFVDDTASATVTDPATKKKTFRDEVLPFAYTAPYPSPVKLPAAHVRRSVVDELLTAAGSTSLDAIEKEIDRKFEPRSFPLKGWTASLEQKIGSGIKAKNVVGVLEGAGGLAKETVVIGAHYDHLGLGDPGDPRPNVARRPAIHHGADDNGSGTAMLIELARRYAAMEDRQGRRLVFAAFSGEELNLLGSEHYVKNPVAPLADTVAMVNLDMVGRLRPDAKTKNDLLRIEGSGTATNFDTLLDSLNRKYSFELKKSPGGNGPSDHASFYPKKIPVLFFWTGDHDEYHLPTDTADRINVPGMVKVANWTEEIVTELATKPRPQFVAVKNPLADLPRGNIPRIGIRPQSYNEEDPVVLTSVTPEGPAEKAGVKAGDKIVEVNGKAVKNFPMYMVQMAAAKKGEPIELTLERDGKKVTVKVKPE